MRKDNFAVRVNTIAPSYGRYDWGIQRMMPYK